MFQVYAFREFGDIRECGLHHGRVAASGVDGSFHRFSALRLEHVLRPLLHCRLDLQDLGARVGIISVFQRQRV